MILTPAYGRDYKNRDEVLADWEAGKDFIVADLFHQGAYANKEDVPKGTTVQFRFNKMRATFSVTL